MRTLGKLCFGLVVLCGSWLSAGEQGRLVLAIERQTAASGPTQTSFGEERRGGRTAAGSAESAGAVSTGDGQTVSASAKETASAGQSQLPTPLPTLRESLRRYQLARQEQDRAVRNRIRTQKDLAEYQKRVRERFLEVLGPWPPRTPLQPTIVGRLEREGYVIEKILIQSQPGFYVPINLYLPTGRKGPLPAVLCPEGHAPKGKAHDVNDNYQARFITLAKKGYIVLAFDPLGQGERGVYGAATGNHHYIQGYQCMPSGRHLASYFLWDCIRCLDYLESRPEVDRNRIACSGCSGGGAITTYLAAIEDRLALAAPTSYVAESIRLTDDTGLHVESWFPDVCGPYGPGSVQMLTCFAPRPLLILGNQQDGEFPPASMEAVFREVQKMYEAIGMADRIEHANVPTPHGYWPEARREFYRFLNRHFDLASVGAEEPPVKTEKEEELWCAPGGQVSNLPGAQTVYSLNRALMAELRAARIERRKTLSAEDYRRFIREAVQRVVHYQPTEGPLGAGRMARREDGAGVVIKMALEYEPAFWTEADLYEPKHSVEGAIVLAADDNPAGREKAAAWAAQGIRVLHLHTQRADDRVEIMAGRPRAGVWAKMLVRGADFLQRQADPPSNRVVGVGLGWTAALAVQMAALVEPRRFAGAAALGGLDRLESLSEQIDEFHSIQMLPGALRWFDEEDLLAALAPCPVLVAGATNKKGSPLSASALAERYGWAVERYGPQHGGRLQLHAGQITPAEMAQWRRSVLESP